MAGITRRTVGLKTTVNTLYTPGCNLFLITVKDSAGPTAIDLTDEDDAVEEVVEAIVKEISPLAYFTVNGSNGIMYVVMDKNINDASELQARIRTIGKDADPATTTSIGPNDIDISGTTVALGTGMTVTT